MPSRRLAVLLGLLMGTLPFMGNAQAPVGGSQLQIVCKDGPGCRLTMLARLRTAPYPFSPSTAIGEGAARPRGRYTDDRVLIHLPRAFDPAKPLRILVFFHGHQATLERDVLGRYAIARQVGESGRNVVLIAPQLAFNAADSHPGKLVRQNGLRDMLDEAYAVIAAQAGIPVARLRDARVILSAYSGGYWAAIESLTDGGISSRLTGLILFDELYGRVQGYANWFARNDQRAFFICLHTRSSAKGTDTLIEAFRARNIPYRVRYPDGPIGEDDNYFVRLDTPHLQVPTAGPPPMPLADILRRLPPFETFLPGAGRRG
jgi:hypothetical protein